MLPISRYALAGVLMLGPLNVVPQGAPAVIVSPAKLEFPAQSAGSPGEAQRVTLSNAGPNSVPLRAVLVSGIDFTEANDCGEKLAAGATCSISITFKPAVTGTRLGALQLSWSGTGSPRTIPLTGLGQ